MPLAKFEATFEVKDLLRSTWTISNLDKHYLLDAMLQNYDLGGNAGNVGELYDGTIVRIDNGGSLTTRASGKSKRFNIDGSTPWQHRIMTWTPEPYDIFDYRMYFSYNDGRFRPYEGQRRGSNLEQLKSQVEEIASKKQEVLSMTQAEFPEHEDDVGNILAARIACLEALSTSELEAIDLVNVLEERAEGDIYNPLGGELVQKMQAFCKSSLGPA